MIRFNRNPSKRELRQFGGIWLLFFSGASALLWYRSGDAGLAAWVWASAVAVVAVGFAYLRFMRLMFLGMSYLTYPVGWTVSHLLIAIIYYLIVTPIALILRLMGRDPLERRLERSAASYWAPHPESEDQSRYFRPF